MLVNSKLKFFFTILIGLGIFFRFANLEHKSYWIDEAFTSLRISGHLEREVAIQQLFDGRLVSPQEFQKYERANPDKGLIDTIRSVSIEETSSTPLYFILARLWNQCFGSSIASTRTLSAFLSVLVLPIVYWLCQELFASSLVGWIAVVLVAISPFHLLYAFQARAYSLWTLVTVLSSALLLRAMQGKTKLSWGIYALSVAMGLYSHLLFGLVAISHGIFVVINDKFRLSKTVISYSLASLLGFLTFIPWLVAIYPNLKQIDYVPTFSGFTLGSLVKMWSLNISRIFMDFNQCFPDIKVIPCVTFNPVHKLVLFLIIPLTLLIGYSFYFLDRKAPRQARLFILTLTGFTALLLILPDITTFEIRRSVSLRYSVPCILGIQLAVAYCLATNIFSQSSKFWQRKLWQAVTLILIAVGLLSCITIAQAKFWWDQGYNYHFEAVAKTINQSEHPLVIYSMNSIYLAPKMGAFSRAATFAHLVDPKVKLQFIVDTNNNPQINFQEFSDIFVYGISDTLREYFKKENYELESLENHSMNQKPVLRKLVKK